MQLARSVALQDLGMGNIGSRSCLTAQLHAYPIIFSGGVQLSENEVGRDSSANTDYFPVGNEDLHKTTLTLFQSLDQPFPPLDAEDLRPRLWLTRRL